MRQRGAVLRPVCEKVQSTWRAAKISQCGETPRNDEGSGGDQLFLASNASIRPIIRTPENASGRYDAIDDIEFVPRQPCDSPRLMKTV